MKHQGGRKPALYSVEMGQWVHRNWLANTAPPPAADVRTTSVADVGDTCRCQLRASRPAPNILIVDGSNPR